MKKICVRRKYIGGEKIQNKYIASYVIVVEQRIIKYENENFDFIIPINSIRNK